MVLQQQEPTKLFMSPAFVGNQHQHQHRMQQQQNRHHDYRQRRTKIIPKTCSNIDNHNVICNTKKNKKNSILVVGILVITIQFILLTCIGFVLHNKQQSSSPSSPLSSLLFQQQQQQEINRQRLQRKRNKRRNRIPDGSFNGYPIYLQTHGNISLPYSLVHCIGENYQSSSSKSSIIIKDDWIHRSCHFSFFCFDIKQHDFVIFRQKQLEKPMTKFRKYRQLIDVSQSYIQYGDIEGSHNDNTTTVSSVSLGRIQPFMNNNDDDTNNKNIDDNNVEVADEDYIGSKNVESSKLEWFPRIRHTPPDSFYVLPDNVVLIPFHSSSSNTLSSLVTRTKKTKNKKDNLKSTDSIGDDDVHNDNRNLISPMDIWNDFLSLYILMDMFQLPIDTLQTPPVHNSQQNNNNNIKEEEEEDYHIYHPLVLRYIFPTENNNDNNMGANESIYTNQLLFQKYWSYFMTHHSHSILTTQREPQLYFTNKKMNKNNDNNNQQQHQKQSLSSTTVIQSNLVCSRHGLAGIGALTATGYDNFKNENDYNDYYAKPIITHNYGRGRIFYKFRNHIMKNIVGKNKHSIMEEEENEKEKNDDQNQGLRSNKNNNNKTKYMSTVIHKALSSRCNIIFSLPKATSYSATNYNDEFDFSQQYQTLQKYFHSTSNNNNNNDNHTNKKNNKRDNEQGHQQQNEVRISKNVSINRYVLKDISLQEQILLAGHTSIFIINCCDDTENLIMTTFLPKGSTVLVYYNDSIKNVEEIENEKGDGGAGRRLNDNKIKKYWQEYLNNLGYIRVHWLPNQTMNHPLDLSMLLELVQHELHIMERIDEKGKE